MWKFPHKNYIYDGLSGRLIRASEEVVQAAKNAIAANPNERIVIEGVAEYSKVRSENARPDSVGGKLRPVTVKVVITEQCNLRCTYCCYVDAENRSHTPFAKGLSEEKLCATIDFLVANIDPETVVSFYGGEPLYRFKDIERVASAVKARRPDWEGTISFTSNMTVFSSKVARFLSENRVVLIASIDGPEEIHDQNRIAYDGIGTFSKVIENMRHLRDFDPEYYRTRVGINSVITTDKFDEIDSFFATEFSDISFIRFGIAKKYGALQLEGAPIRDSLQNWAREKLLTLTSLEQIDRSPLLKDFIRNYLMSVIDRKSVQNGKKGFTPCAPGSRLIVNTDMSVGVCERTEGLTLGSVASERLNTDGIANSFANLLENRCKYCFAAPACAICYASIWDGNGLSRDKLDAYCDSFRTQTMRHLEIYTHARERFGGTRFDDFVEHVVKRNERFFEVIE
jgi:uncharacterized protein